MLIFDKETHTYTLDDTIIPSVTQILKSAGIIDTSFFNKSGAERGTFVHTATEYLDKGVLDFDDLSPGLLPYVRAWEKFKESIDMDIISIEELMHHSGFRYGGCVDRVVRIDGVLTVIDLKSGASQAWHELQLVLYGLMVAEVYKEIPELMCVYLKETGKYAVKKYGYENRLTGVAAVRVANWRKKNGM